MQVEELKSKLVSDLYEVGNRLSSQQKMLVAVNLEIALATVKRYMSGNAEEVRKLDLAEQILDEAKKVLSPSE